MGEAQERSTAPDLTRRLTRRHGLALAVIAVLAMLSVPIMFSAAQRHADLLEVLNMSGRQRMLSQRVALFADMLHHAPTPGQAAIHARHLEEALDRFETEYEYLLAAPTDAPYAHVRQFYFEGPNPLDQRLRAYFAAARAVLEHAGNGASPAGAAVHHLRDEAIRIVEDLDEVVARYQTAGSDWLLRLELIQLGVIILLLLALAAETRFVFQPLVLRIGREIDKTRRMAEDLRESRDRLEDKVQEQTAAIRASMEAAERANHSRLRLVATASHDLRQPLQVMSLLLGLLRTHGLEPKSAQVVDKLDGLHASIREMLDYLLDMSRLEAGVVVPYVEAVPLRPLVERLVAEFAVMAEGKGLSLRGFAIDATVASDPRLLEQVLRNLLANAVRYTEAGGILIGCRRRGDSIVIQVWDTGIGIGDSDLPHIFEEYRQVQRSSQPQGLGLGLAIVSRAAALLGHGLQVASTLGRGSVFSLTVPQAQGDTPQT